CVKLARHRKTNEQVAIKIISKASLVNRAAVHRGIEREIAIMKLINHPHVIRLYDVYETDKELFLVMEYVSGGELFEYLVNKGRLDEAEALRFFQQIIVGLAFCHKRKIWDLKPENLLLDDKRNVKIADFGMASLQKSGRLLETSCGSPHYASPEVVTGMKYDGSSSDIWSCGIILYALLTGHLPFDDENIRQLLSKVKAGKFYMPSDISAGARDLISRMLTVNPKRRITMQGVMIHPWFRMVSPERNTLKEPSQDLERGRPMLVEELDAEIVRHMRWLFAPGPSHSDPEAKEVFDEEALLLEIQEKMTNNEENMEKIFYNLLCQHKAELLENYSGDESDIAPDAPRRRADSFPNSATCSIRSATPEFGRTPLSPRDSPITSPGSPYVTATKGTEPAPLNLNSESTNITARPGYTIESKKGQILANLNGAGFSNFRQESPDLSNKYDSVTDPHDTPAFRKGDNGRCEDTKEYGKSTQKAAPISAENSNQAANTKLGKIHQSTASGHMTQLPPLHPMEAIMSNQSAEEGKKSSSQANSESSDTTAAQSIESQVLSTQISEISNTSTVPSTPFRQSVEGNSGSSSTSSSAEKIRLPTIGIKGKRPILHPLDIKTTAGTAASNVSASQHSRKYSEGTSSVISTTPMSPKRPWFTRLFDFKPQPLVFKSSVSAVEAQERVETILKNLFVTGIHIEKRQSFGVKCRYEGGVIGDQPVKPVKFKVDISEKLVFLQASAASTLSRSNSSRTDSSSAVAAVLAAAESSSNNNNSNIHASNCTSIFKRPTPGSSSSSSNGSVIVGHGPSIPAPKKKSSDILAGRRASDGGSILSSAAAAVTSHFAAKFSFNHNSSNSSKHHRHSVHGVAVPNPGQPQLSQMQPGRIVRVTLHQQQGANSTLRMIFEKLCAAWDLPFDQQHPQQQGYQVVEVQERQVPVTTSMTADV
ncbi:hypothetical protein BGZ76_004470, partial [Entomortierella beljakovae]